MLKIQNYKHTIKHFVDLINSNLAQHYHTNVLTLYNLLGSSFQVVFLFLLLLVSDWYFADLFLIQILRCTTFPSMERLRNFGQYLGHLNICSHRYIDFEESFINFSIKDLNAFTVIVLKIKCGSQKSSKGWKRRVL